MEGMNFLFIYLFVLILFLTSRSFVENLFLFVLHYCDYPHSFHQLPLLVVVVDVLGVWAHCQQPAMQLLLL